MVALLDGQPKLLSLKEMLDAFLRHRREVVTRRTIHDLRKARERAHILEGLAVALANIDEVIALIKASPSPPEARAALQARTWGPGAVPAMLARAGNVPTRPEGIADELGLHGGAYRLSEAQAQAILDLRLHRLTGLEQDKIVTEFTELLEQIRDLGEILARPERLLAVIREELTAIKEAYGDARRTQIVADQSDVTIEDLIERQDLVVTLSHAGYAKTQPVTDYEAQRRGGKGKMATTVKDEDFVDKLFIAHSHDTLLCFSDGGQCYWLKVYQLPLASRGSRGKPIVNLLQLAEGERITAVLAIREFDESHFVFMATALGTVKKTPLSAFSRPRANGIIAASLEPSDCLVGVALTDGAARDPADHDGRQGNPLRGGPGAPDGPRSCRRARHQAGRRPARDFADRARRGRDPDGVRARLRQADRDGRLPAARPRRPGRHRAADQRAQRRRWSARGRCAATTKSCSSTRAARWCACRSSDIPVLGRNTQGVRIMRLEEGEKLVGLERIAGDDSQGGEGAG